MKEFYLVPVKEYSDMKGKYSPLDSDIKIENEKVKSDVLSSSAISPEVMLEILDLIDSRKLQNTRDTSNALHKCDKCSENRNYLDRNKLITDEMKNSTHFNEVNNTDKVYTSDQNIKTIYERVINELKKNNDIEFGGDSIYIKSLKSSLNLSELMKCLLIQNSGVSNVKREIAYIVNTLPNDLIINWRAKRLNKIMIGSGKTNWLHY